MGLPWKWLQVLVYVSYMCLTVGMDEHSNIGRIEYIITYTETSIFNVVCEDFPSQKYEEACTYRSILPVSYKAPIKKNGRKLMNQARNPTSSPTRAVLNHTLHR